MTDEQKLVIIPEKSPDYKVVFADGGYTWVNSNSGTITFFNDTFVPDVSPDGSLNIKSIKRVFTIEVRMTRDMYQKVIAWMSGQFKILEEFEAKEKKDKE